MRALGIDVGVRKRFDLVLLDAERQPVERRRKVEPADLDELIRAWRPDVIAIDAPPQWGTHAGGSRLTERELRRFGIQSFGTPSDERKAENSFYEWMTVGFAAYEAAARCGYPRYSRGRVTGTAMEVFPHASAVVLHGCLPQRDAKKRAFRTEVLLAQRVSLDGLRSMDQLDAAMAALTGLLALDGLCFAPGDPKEGVIVLPARSGSGYSMLRHHEAAVDVQHLPRDVARRIRYDEGGRLRDVAYVEGLALPDTIVTVPEKTLLAFAEHGVPRLADGTADGDAHTAAIARARRAGVDLDVIGAELEVAGLRAFAEAYADVIDHITARVAPQPCGEAA